MDIADIKRIEISDKVERNIKFTTKNFNNLKNFIKLSKEHKNKGELNLRYSDVVNSILDDFPEMYDCDNIKPNHISGTKRNIKFTKDNFNKMRNHVRSINENKKNKSSWNLEYSDIINPLLDNLFKDFVFDNTFIELDNWYYYNREEFQNNGVVTATNELGIGRRKLNMITKT